MAVVLCPNPFCSSPPVKTTVVATLAEPGKNRWAGLLARLGVARASPVSTLIVYVVAAFCFPFWWNTMGAVALPIYLVLGLDAVSRLGMRIMFLRGAPQMHITTYKCPRCGYSWRSSDTPRETQIGRYVWEVERLRKSNSSKDRPVLASILSDLSGFLVIQGQDLGRARQLGEEALEIRRGLGTPPQTAYTLNNVAFALFGMGQSDRARPFAEEAVVMFRGQHNWQALAYSLNTLGWAVLDGGDAEGARNLFTEALVLQQKMAEVDPVAWNLEGLAAVAAAQGQFARAVRLSSAAGAIRDANSCPLDLRPARDRQQHLLERARSFLGDQAFEQERRAGEAMQIHEAASYATGLILPVFRSSAPGKVRSRLLAGGWGALHLLLLALHASLLLVLLAEGAMTNLVSGQQAAPPLQKATAVPAFTSDQATTYKFRVYADSYQFYLEDPRADWSAVGADFWSPQTITDRMAIAPGIMALGTDREDIVPLEFEVLSSPPTHEDLSAWDHVVEGSLELLSGELMLEGVSDGPAATIIPLRPGTYRVRSYSGGLNPQGEVTARATDHYRVSIWPQAARPVVVLKQWKAGR